jgi:hypothetical protein
MKRAVKVPGVLLCVYALSYVVLSTFGAYAPAVWGIGQQGMRPKGYAWAPRGFYNPATGDWMHTPIRIFYAPLSAADGPFPEDSDPTHPVVFPGFKHK